jgi:hypothetical protein
MRKTHTVRITSVGCQKDFERKGLSGLEAVECLKAHIDRTQSSKQVFSVTLEDGAPEPPRDMTRAQVDRDKAMIRLVLTMKEPDWRTQIATVMLTADRLSDVVKDAIANPAAAISAVKMRQGLIGLQACRELIDEIADRED